MKSICLFQIIALLILIGGCSDDQEQLTDPLQENNGEESQQQTNENAAATPSEDQYNQSSEDQYTSDNSNDYGNTQISQNTGYQDDNSENSANQQFDLESGQAPENGANEFSGENVYEEPAEEYNPPPQPNYVDTTPTQSGPQIAQSVGGNQTSIDLPLTQKTKENGSLKEPEISKLWWVGYDFQNEKRQVQIELVTKGEPRFDIYKEINKSRQPELVVRFYDTTLRKKLLYDVNASEFKSPVAYIRTEEGDKEATVDVTITLRDPIAPRLFSREGNILLTFEIPDKYYGNSSISELVPESAVLLSKVDPSPMLLPGSNQPLSMGTLAWQDPSGDVFQEFANEEQPIEEPADGILPVDSLEEPAPSNPVNYEIQNTYQPNQSQTNYESTGSNTENYGSEGPSYGSGSNSQSYEEEGSNSYESQDNESDSYNDENSNENYQSDEEYNNDYGVIIEQSFSWRSVAQDQYNQEENIQQNNQYNIGSNNLNFSTDQYGAQQQNANNQYNQQIGNNQYDQQSDEQYEENGDEIGNDAAAPPENELPPDRPISLEFRGALLQEVINVLAAESGVNFVFTQEIGNHPVHVSLQNVPWEYALQAVLDTHDLGIIKLKGNIIRIDDKKKILGEIEVQKKMEKVEDPKAPTKVLIVRLSYAKAEETAPMILSLLSVSKDDRVRVAADKRTNSLIIEAVPNDLVKAKALVQRIDLQTPQVKIAARIIEVLRTDSDFFGIDWNNPFRNDAGRGLGFGSLVFPNNMFSGFAVDTNSTTQAIGGRWDLQLGSLNNSVELDLRLRMSEQKGETRILENTSIVVLDNQRASIKVGKQDVFIVGENKEFKTVDYLLDLEVIPKITVDGAILMEIKIKNSNPSQVASNSAVAGKISRDIETNMLKMSGETGVIGGLYTTSKDSQEIRVPFFADLPILGALFRSKGESVNRRELMVMVTPVIMDNKGSGMQDGGLLATAPQPNGGGNYGSQESGGYNSQDGNNYGTQNAVNNSAYDQATENNGETQNYNQGNNQQDPENNSQQGGDQGYDNY